MESVAKIHQFDSLFLRPPVGHEANQVLTLVTNYYTDKDERRLYIVSLKSSAMKVF